MLADTAYLPEQATTTAERVDGLFWFVFTVCGLVGLMVAVLLFYFAIRYRRRPGDTLPPASAAHPALEWFWTLTPLGIFAVMFLWGADVYVDAYRPPDDTVRIYGVGKQWMWKFQHPEGQREINSLHVPTGQSVQLLLVSEDVIHSFFVPDFRIHMDALPNRYTSLAFEATRPGEYHLFCTEYCGTNHSGMIGTVVVMEPSEYEDWLASLAEGSLALEGRKVFLKYRCVSCHTGAADAAAPVLEGLFERPTRLSTGELIEADEAYVRESVLAPNARIVAGWQNIMPTFQGQITEEEIYALIAYLRALQPGETPPRVEEFPPPVDTPQINEEPLP